MSKQIDHEYTAVIVCPHCGFADWDTCADWTWRDGESIEIQCPNCNKIYNGLRETSVTYFSEEIVEGEDDDE